MFFGAVDTNMRLGDGSYWCGVVQGLQECVGVRIEDIGLESRVLGVIVETGISVVRKQHSLKVEVFYTKFGILDLHPPVEFGHAVDRLR